jgi:uncharacterized protein YjbI with pentapeptide repeats
MKAKELLNLYAEGTRDFRGENLQGLSFRGKDLSGADFSKANIRGTDFSRANLTGAKFVKAKAGLPMRSVIILLIACFLLSVMSGVFASSATTYLPSMVNDKTEPINFLPGVSIVLLLSLQFIYRGLNVNFAVAIAVAVAISGAAAVAGVFTGVATISLVEALAAMITGAVAAAVTVAVATAGSVSIFVAAAITGAVIAAYPFVYTRVIPVTITFLLMLSYSYLGWRAIKGDPRDEWIRTIALAFAVKDGTKFYEAILTDADFTKAILRNTDLEKATLTRTCFRDTIKLDLVCPGDTYLKSRQVQELVQTGQGQFKIFDREDLQGVYLKRTNLKGASFIEANLQEACLQEADLSDAKLVHTLLDQTDLTGATLTGAYLEGCSITPETILKGIKCDYLFMRLPPDKRPDFMTLLPEETRSRYFRRQPANPNENFKEGDFDDFITPLKQTLNLYYDKSTAPRLMALAFKQLIENNPGADIELVDLDKKSQNKNKVLIRAETALQADHAVLNARDSKKLAYLQSLPLEAIRALLIERESTINLLRELIDTKHQSPDVVFNSSPNVSINQNQGNTMSDKSSSFQFGDVGGDVAGIAGGDISGVAGKDMTGVAGGDIGQLAKAEAPEPPKLADLLQQLESAIESDAQLPEKDKAKALKQVKALEEAGQNPNDEDKKDLADTAITMLKGILSGIPAIAACVKASQELLPLITSLFGL